MTKYVVVDHENGGTVGPFDSEEEAKAYFIALAVQEEWGSTVELIEKTGSPFGSDGYGSGLTCEWLDEPATSVLETIRIMEQAKADAQRDAAS
jgi:hypothetical protein